MTTPAVPRRIATALTLALVCAALAQQADSPPTEPRELAEQRWREDAYGISIRPPVGTRLFEQTADDYLLRIIDDGRRFQITVALKQSHDALTLEQVVASAQQQIESLQPASDVIGREAKKIGSYDGAFIYFRVPPATTGDNAMIGQAIARLDPRRFVVFEIRSSIHEGRRHIPTFEAVAQTLEVADQAALAEQRKQAAERGHAWRQRLTVAQLHDALIDEQYFRLVQGDRDIGYMRVRQETTDQGVKINPESGVSVEVQSRMVLGELTVDSLATMYLANDDTSEVWNVTTTYRQPNPESGQTDARTFTETGARSGARIEVAVNGPRGMKKYSYKRPIVGYLSKVESQMIGQLLPPDRAATYGFYWYDSTTGKLTFRTDQVTPTLTGYTLATRLNPKADPLRATFDSAGRMLSKQLSPDRTLIAATQKIILNRWQHR